ncbi:GNAT family N-acetyltransferase [Paraferrimonas sedimenticola]|uniref:ElaA protein n=1 Tax=Paraferrimonas sedimenticola TaxID=375674 RepID=A0AA37RV90_9GAMM|nr:GNAT family N-acetyltransferase [Paraferrimonas sedimenticola]GLP95895.1 ElaA protein [Paraferrimonas sedimenticola]
MQWLALPFHELSRDQLYDLMQLRVDVFVVEQECAYPELDNKDRHTGVWHLLGYGGDGRLHAYLRALPAGLSYPQPSMGRVVVHPDYRGQGLGQLLVMQGLDLCQREWPNTDIKISAQSHLTRLYQEFGFKVTSPEYLDDGIPHVDMVLSLSSPTQ